jgi:Enoyl-CoA hydratase/carnithine racemase
MALPEQDKPVVTVQREGAIAIVTINRPESMNALSHAVFHALNEIFAGLGDDVLVAVLTGAGERAFCAGLDMKELGSDAGHPEPAAKGQGVGHTRFGMAAFQGVVIGAINGVAVAGGLELALCCDIRIASTTARFGDAHSRVGMLPGALLGSLLPHLIGVSRAKEIALSSRLIDAATAERWGLVNRLVEPERLLDEAMALARDIARHDRKIILAYNSLISEAYGMNYSDAVDHEFHVAEAFNAGH